jgi:hypothetical protein
MERGLNRFRTKKPHETWQMPSGKHIRNREANHHIPAIFFA